MIRLTCKGDLIASKEGHDLVSAELLELRAQTGSDTGRSGAQLFAPVSLPG